MFKTRAVLALTLLTQAGACVEQSTEPKPVETDASAATGSDAGTDAGTSARSFEAFDDALEQAIAAHNAEKPEQAIRGASAVIVDKVRGIVHSQGYGEYDADRLYLIASASKILSVGVLMRLADQGLLDIDAPISTYLGDWGAHKTDVSVAQLVSNSSGLPSLGEISKVASSMDPAALARLLPHFCQYREAGSLADCGKAIYTDDAPENNRPADKMFDYGGSQWQLAGAVAEQVSGKSWAELVQETYVEPCGVQSLGYTNQFEKSALGYPAFFQADPANLPMTQNPSIEGGAYITAQDYGTLLWMHLRGGTCGDEQVLSSEAVARMQEDRVGGYGQTTGNPALPGYGLGWWVNDEADYVADPGAYGAYPLIDQKRDYAAFIVIEVSSEVGSKLAQATKPVLDRIFEGDK